jgi:AraC-like DNA-binding protein
MNTTIRDTRRREVGRWDQPCGRWCSRELSGNPAGGTSQRIRGTLLGAAERCVRAGPRAARSSRRHTQLILNLAQPFESCQDGEWRLQPRCFLAGQITGPLLLRPIGEARMLGVRFRAHGAGRMLGTPMPETTSRIVDLSDLVPALARDLDGIWDAPSAAAQTARADAIFAAWDRRHGRRDRVVEEAVARVTSARLTPARVPLDTATLARALGISLRQLERRFQNAVGLGPKHFARMRRFQRVFQAIEEQRPGWADAAVAC